MISLRRTRDTAKTLSVEKDLDPICHSLTEQVVLLL